MAQSPRPVAAHSGMHYVEWACELVGTALLLIGGTAAVVFGFLPSSPLHTLGPGWRRLITGLLFAGSGALVTISPLGRRSGAHLNPAVTLGFFVNKHSTKSDLGGYTVSQIIGAILGSGLVALAVHTWDRSINYAVTKPGHGAGTWGTFGIELLTTAGLVFSIFWFVSSKRTARFTPLFVWLLITFYVWWLAPYTGTSLNPARTLGPDIISDEWYVLWVYIVAPLAGSMLACLLWLGVRSRSTLTAKLFHDEKYVSTMRSELPAKPVTS